MILNQRVMAMPLHVRGLAFGRCVFQKSPHGYRHDAATLAVQDVHRYTNVAKLEIPWGGEQPQIRGCAAGPISERLFHAREVISASGFPGTRR